MYSKPSTPLGIRNNNPLNIEARERWLGAAGDDGRFVIFETPEHGIRAAGRILRTYALRHGRKTVNTIIARWAPPEDDNDTEGYIDFVANRAGVRPDKELTGDEYPRVLEAMIQMENGQQPYSMDTIKTGFEWGFYG
ncbi:virion protein [Pseudoalteromonas rubra]|uniref:virion protein n=1 Tax=Pseudoalteromonas rubra TaxID=43658 RepID=UPI002DB72CBB|nr:virion protein [Pseudoalteromonas rubra]MEC4091152.1 virion protein [Pseudoalteromonas rubra]